MKVSSYTALIENFWSDLMFKQQSSWIYRSAGTGVPAEQKIWELCCSNVKSDQKISICVFSPVLDSFLASILVFSPLQYAPKGLS